MYLDSHFKVEHIEHHPELGRTVRLGNWPKRTRTCTLYDTDLDLEEGDILHANIQNHDPDSGWAMDTLHGFPYDDERKDCDVCR